MIRCTNELKLIAAIIICGGCQAANAQSSVTLYGLVSPAVTYVNRAGSGGAVGPQWAVQNGTMQGNRWGLLGSEDLGASMKAVFRLESGFSIVNGTMASGLEFGRQAYVGISTRYGTITLGRQYSEITDLLSPTIASQVWATFLSAHNGDVDDGNGSYRLNNSIKYASPTRGGLTFAGVFSLGGVAGNFESQRAYSVGFSFTSGPLYMAGAYLDVKNPSSSIWFGTQPVNGSTSYSNPITNPAWSGYATANSYKVAGLGATYRMDKVTLGFNYMNTRFIDPISTSVTPHAVGAVFNVFEASGRYEIAPDFSVGSVFVYTKTRTARYQQFTLIGDYVLSKRTDAYLAGVFQHAGGVDSTGREAVADISGLSPSSTGKQVAVQLGLRHKF